MAKKPKTVTLMLPESFVEQIEEVRIRIGAKSHSEVIRRAFALLKKLDPDFAAKVGALKRKQKKSTKKK